LQKVPRSSILFKAKIRILKMSARSSSRVHAQSEKNKEEQEKAEKLRIEKAAAAAEKKEAAAKKEEEEEKKKAAQPVKLKLKISKPPTVSVSAKVDQAMEAYQKALAESLPSSTVINAALTLEIPEERSKSSPTIISSARPQEKKPAMTSLMAAAMGETYIPGPEDLPKAPKQQRKKYVLQQDDSDEEKEDIEMDDKKKGNGKRRARTTVINDTDEDEDEEEYEKPVKKAKKMAAVKVEPESRHEAPRPSVKAPKKPEGGPMQKYVQGGKKESKPKESRPVPSVPLPLPALPIRPHRAPTPEDVTVARGLADELHQATESKNWNIIMTLLSPSGAIAQLPKTIELSSSSTIAMRLRGAQAAASLASSESSSTIDNVDSSSNLANEALQLCNNMLSLFKEECKAIVEWEKAYKIAHEELQIIEKKNAEIEARAAGAAAKAAAKEAERAAAKQAEIDLRESRLANLKAKEEAEVPSSEAIMDDSNLFFSEEKIDSSPKVAATVTAKTDKPDKSHDRPQTSTKPEAISMVTSKPQATAPPPVLQKAVASTASLLKGMQQSSSKAINSVSVSSAKVSSGLSGAMNSSGLAKELSLPWPTSSEITEVGNVQVPHSIRSTAATLLHALFQETALWPTSAAAPTLSEIVQKWMSRITERLAISAENKLFEATQQNSLKTASVDGLVEPPLLKLQRAFDMLLISAREEKNRAANDSSDVSTPRAVAARQLFIALQETGVKARTSVLSSSSAASSETIKEDDKQREALSILLPLVFSLCEQVISK